MLSDEDTAALNTLQTLISRIQYLRICDIKWIIERMQYELQERTKLGPSK